MRGGSNYFKHAAAKHTVSSLENFVWHRVIRTAGDGRMSADTTLAATAAGCDPRRTRSPTRDPGQPRLTTDPAVASTLVRCVRRTDRMKRTEATSAPRLRPTQRWPATRHQISDAAVSSRCLRRYGRNGVLPVPIVVGLAGLDCACSNTYSAAYPRCRDLNRSIQVMQVL